jgi:mono/diheme cytochrome c family protein
MLSKEQINALTTFLLGAVETSFPVTYRFEPEDARADIQQGWWLIQRYNCNGCHQIRPGDVTSLMNVPRYKDPAWVEQLPPQLYTEGARVQPDWLVRFLTNPALSETNTNRNGVRQYLQAHMPTFYLSERQVGKLMRFFMARSTQPHPFIPEEIEPLSAQEQTLARVLFTGRAAPCLKCHMNGDPAHDRTATAPNFLIASERLKSDWTYRWMLEPAKIAPGTAMPSELFRQEGNRWVFNGNLPPMFNSYQGDHARLLVRYMFLITPAEVQRLRAASVQ